MKKIILICATFIMVLRYDALAAPPNGGTPAPDATASKTDSVDTVPVPPGDLSINTVGFNRITLKWTNNPDLAADRNAYLEIERKTGDGEFTRMGKVGSNVTGFVDNSPAPETNYSYRIRAVGSGGTSSYSNVPPSVTTKKKPISAPGNLGVSAFGVDHIDLKWKDNSNNETAFIIERSPTATLQNFVKIGEVAAGVTTFHDSGLNPSTVYFYRVRATKGGTENSSFCKALRAKTSIPAPSGLKLTVINSSTVRLDWTDNSNNEAQFAIFRKKKADGKYAEIHRVRANVTTYRDTKLATDTPYYYRVGVPQIAFGGPSDKSLDSDEVSVIVLPTPILKAVATSTKGVDLTWTDSSSNVAGFKIERKSDIGGSWKEIATVPSGQKKYSNTGLKANTSYVYRVRAFRNAAGTDIGGASDYSNVANVSTLIGGTLPSVWHYQDVGASTPVGDVGYASGVFVIKGAGYNVSPWLTGMPSSDKFFYVYQPLSGNGSITARVANIEHSDDWANAGVMIRETLAGDSSYAMVAVTPGYGNGISFLYRVAAGASRRITPRNAFAPPYWVKLVRSGNTFTGYESPDGATWVSLGSVTIPMGANAFVGLPVCSNAPTLCRALVDNVSVKTSIPKLSNVPTGLTASNLTPTSVTLKWADSSNDVKGFRVERSLGEDAGTYVEVGAVGAGVTSYSDKDLTEGTPYRYRVVAYNAGGDAISESCDVTTPGGVIPPLVSTGKPATAKDSNYSNQPKLGNDGNLGGTPWTAGNQILPKWWKVDLGVVYHLKKVKIAWNNAATISYRYQIEVSNDDVTYTVVSDRTGNTSFGDTTDDFSADGRYLRVNITGVSSKDAWVGFRECRVYRTGSEPVSPTDLKAVAKSPSQIDLSWTDNSKNESSYRIERRAGTGGAFITIGTANEGETTFSDHGATAGMQYYYRVCAHSDVHGDSIEYTNEATATTPAGGAFTRTFYTGITGKTVAALTADPRFTATPRTPTGTGTLQNFEAPSGWGDNYGQVISGLVHPPASGNYTFWIASTDQSELWLSTDGAEANCILIAAVEDQTAPREWTKHARNAVTIVPVQESAPVPMVAGKSYYIKALHKASTGPGDHLAVAWAGPGFSRQILSDTGLPLMLSITSPANGQKIPEGSNITIGTNAIAAEGRSIARVEFALRLDTKNEMKLGEDTTPPYSFTWKNVATGPYVFVARAWDNAGVSTEAKVKVMVTNSTFGLGAWSERILNGDGSINWTEYANVADHYDRRDMLEYRFGPSYAYYHSTPDAFPTLRNAAGEDGITGHSYTSGNTDWYSEGGQLLFSPNASAPAKYQPGVALAWNGDVYPYDNDAVLKYCFVNGLQWNNEDGHGQQMPDPSVKQPSFIAANGGTVPVPVATVRTRGAGGITGFLIFRNGFITATGNSALTDSYRYVLTTPRYPFIQLADGKVPTAGAVTLNNEFLLVTVWDTVNHKGQVAVVANDGQLRAQQISNNNKREEYFWGLPNRFKVRAMKVLGYVDLPFAAPTAINISNDVFKDGIGMKDNDGLRWLLESQSERDKWHNWTGGDYKKTPKSGYAVVASRAENKVAFLDLQPLFEYYRQMYFTTQANYDLTKNQGTAPNQWPYMFDISPEQKPTLYATIGVPNPTAVMAGPPVNPYSGAGTTNAYRTNAYIATMDGSLLIYDIGDLMTPASGGSLGKPVSTVTIGKNPTSIDNNIEWRPGTAVNCRGDKSICLIDAAGTMLSTLRDSRIQDPVYTTVSQNGRSSHGTNLLHVMDFEGGQVLTYRYGNEKSQPPIAEPSRFEFTHADPLPGCPFMFTRMGVN